MDIIASWGLAALEWGLALTELGLVAVAAREGGRLIPVQSSNIKAVGYHGTTLTIAFKSGGTYTYAAVPAAVHAGLMAAESKGKFFHRAIRGRYAYRKVGGAQDGR